MKHMSGRDKQRRGRELKKKAGADWFSDRSVHTVDWTKKALHFAFKMHCGYSKAQSFFGRLHSGCSLHRPNEALAKLQAGSQAKATRRGACRDER